MNNTDSQILLWKKKSSSYLNLRHLISSDKKKEKMTTERISFAMFVSSCLNFPWMRNFIPLFVSSPCEACSKCATSGFTTSSLQLTTSATWASRLDWSQSQDLFCLYSFSFLPYLLSFFQNINKWCFAFSATFLKQIKSLQMQLYHDRLWASAKQYTVHYFFDNCVCSGLLLYRVLVCTAPYRRGPVCVLSEAWAPVDSHSSMLSITETLIERAESGLIFLVIFLPPDGLTVWSQPYRGTGSWTLVQIVKKVGKQPPYILTYDMIW